MRAHLLKQSIFVSLMSAALTSAMQGQATPQANPPRDGPPPAATGTAVITGRVVAGDTRRPLRRVRVTVAAPELGGQPRNVSTDADGQYEVRDLPAARYRLTVTRSGYLTLQYGQRRPQEQGKPVQVLDKQRVDHVDFVLPRMSLITGRITDDQGDPIEGVGVLAMRSRFRDGRRQLVPTGSGISRTDDAGQYRILGLTPGSYYVMASTRETWTVSDRGVLSVMGYAPTYFPGTTRVTDARRVTVALGQEGSNTDLALMPGRTASVSGTAFDSRGKPFAQVVLNQEVRGDNFASFGTVSTATVAADGTFTLRNVSPGEYKVTASNGRDTDHPEAAVVPVLVDSIDVTDVSVRGSDGGTISGQVVTESGIVPLIPRLRVSMGLPSTGQPDPVLIGAFRNLGTALVAEDGLFSVKGAFGRSRLRVTLPDEWMVKAILHDGRDVADQPIELRSGEVMAGVQVIVSNRVTTVAGQLPDDKGAPTTDGTILVFAEQEEKWAEDSRAVRATRPDQQGQWQIKGLPPGDYFAIALDYVEDGTWNDPEFLESLRRSAMKFTLAEAGSQTIALKLVVPEAGR